MKIDMKIKKVTLIGLITMIGTTAFAQHRHHPVPRHSGPAVVVVDRPATFSHISNRLSKKDRLNMALAYLKSNKTLSISKYSKMTGLKRATAEAELDAFAMNKNNPIKMIMNGKKKLYVV